MVLIVYSFSKQNSLHTTWQQSQSRYSLLVSQMERYSTIKRKEWSQGILLQAGKSMRRSILNPQWLTRVKSDALSTLRLMDLMCSYLAVPTEQSNYGNQRMPRQTNVSRHWLDTKAPSSTWYISIRSSSSLQVPHMVRCIFGGLIKRGVYWCTHGSSRVKESVHSLLSQGK